MNKKGILLILRQSEDDPPAVPSTQPANMKFLKYEIPKKSKNTLREGIVCNVEVSKINPAGNKF